MRPAKRLLSSAIGFVAIFVLIAGVGSGVFAQKRSQGVVTPDDPIWAVVDVEFVEKFPEMVTLEDLKADEQLAGMLVLKRGMRLSIQPVDKVHFDRVRMLGRRRK